MDKHMMTGRQAVMLFVMYQIGSAFLVLPSTLARAAKQDAWMSVMVAVIIQLLLTPLYIAIARQLKGKTLSAYINSLWGRWAGSLFLLGFSFAVPFLIFTMTLRNLGDFITTTLMPETPVEPLYAIMLFAVIYIVWSGVTVIGRTAELLFFVVVVLFLILAVSLLPSVDYTNLMPILEHGIKPVLKGTFPLLAFPYLESALFLFLVPHLHSIEKWKNALRKSIWMSGVFFIVLTATTISVLSEGVVANLTFPSYSVIRTISIADFYERIEVLVTVLWFITIFFRLTLLMHLTTHTLGEVFRLQDSRAIVIPLALIAFFGASAVWPNIVYLMRLFEIWPSYAMLFGLLIPLLIWGSGFIKRKLAL